MNSPDFLMLMRKLDAQAKDLLDQGADDMDLFAGMADHMGDVKTLLDHPNRKDLETLASKFPSFHRYAVVLSNIAQGISDGSIKVPK